MESRQTFIIILLVVSIVFSVTSILLTMSLDVTNNNTIRVPYQYYNPDVKGSSSGGVGLLVEPSTNLP